MITTWQHFYSPRLLPHLLPQGHTTAITDFSIIVPYILIQYDTFRQFYYTHSLMPDQVI